MNHAKNMYQYHVWANKALLERIKELPSNVLYKEVRSSYPTIAQTFSHIFAVDAMWLQVLKGIDIRKQCKVLRLMQKGLIYILQMNLRRLMMNWLHSLKNG